MITENGQFIVLAVRSVPGPAGSGRGWLASGPAGPRRHSSEAALNTFIVVENQLGIFLMNHKNN